MKLTITIEDADAAVEAAAEEDDSHCCILCQAAMRTGLLKNPDAYSNTLRDDTTVYYVDTTGIALSYDFMGGKREFIAAREKWRSLLPVTITLTKTGDER